MDAPTIADRAPKLCHRANQAGTAALNLSDAVRAYCTLRENNSCWMRSSTGVSTSSCSFTLRTATARS